MIVGNAKIATTAKSAIIALLAWIVMTARIARIAKSAKIVRNVNTAQKLIEARIVVIVTLAKILQNSLYGLLL